MDNNSDNDTSNDDDDNDDNDTNNDDDNNDDNDTSNDDDNNDDNRKTQSSMLFCLIFSFLLQRPDHCI